MCYSGVKLRIGVGFILPSPLRDSTAGLLDLDLEKRIVEEGGRKGLGLIEQISTAAEALANEEPRNSFDDEQVDGGDGEGGDGEGGDGDGDDDDDDDDDGGDDDDDDDVHGNDDDDGSESSGGSGRWSL